MITIGFSTRNDNPEYIKHLQKMFSHPKVQIIQKINNGEKSLTKVYNEILVESKFNYVVLLHDDLILETKNLTPKIIKMFEKTPEYGVIGIAGTTDLIDGRWWRLKESMNGIVTHARDGKTWVSKYSEHQGETIKDVVVLDGLFLIVNKNKIKHNFDEEFDGFHLYDVSFCFSNYINGVKIGLTTQFKVTHKSIGMVNEQWEKNKKQFEEKYKSNLPVRLTNNKFFEEKLVFDPKTIGIGMVTYNAEDRIKQSAFTVPKWVENFVIVNDGTPYDSGSYPEHAHIIQHEVNKSVGQAKNSAMKYLMELGCEHIFLIEDDILIKNEKVFEEYIKHSLMTGIKHLNFGLHGPANKKGSKGFTDLNDRKDIDGEPNPRAIVPYDDNVKIYLYPNCVGAFSYYHKSVIEKIGYFDPIFKNAWEHVDHTLQAIKHGYHPPFWYFADIENSWNYITDIPNSIENSTIARTVEWSNNYKRGTTHFKDKNGYYPTEIPIVNNEIVGNNLRMLYSNR